MIKLAIATPCTQTWDTMQPAAIGRHCASCQQIVHDFSEFTDAELVTWFAQREGSTCGRLRDDQLNVLLYDNRPVAAKGLSRWLRWAITMILGWQTTKGQALMPNFGQQRSQQPIVRTSRSQTAAQDTALFHVHGQVVSESGKPQSYIMVKKADTGWFTTTDTMGRFQVPIYAADQTVDSLQIIVNGGSPIQVSTKPQQFPLVIPISIPVLEEIRISVGGISVFEPRPPKLIRLPTKGQKKP